MHKVKIVTACTKYVSITTTTLTTTTTTTTTASTKEYNSMQEIRKRVLSVTMAVMYSETGSSLLSSGIELLE